MNYYDQKTKALEQIKSMADQNVSIEDIRFFIYESYGFSEKFVNKYYDELLTRGFIKETLKKKGEK